MIRTLGRNWWLLVLCGILDAALAAIYLIIQSTNEPILGLTWNNTLVLAGKLTMAVGACTVVAAIWRSREGASWALALNGMALVALGFTQYRLTRFPISILAFALLVTLAAGSFGLAEFSIGRRMSTVDTRTFSVLGLLSVVVALPLLALGLRWIPIAPASHPDLLWLGAYFGLGGAGPGDVGREIGLGAIARLSRAHSVSPGSGKVSPPTGRSIRHG